MKEQEISPEFSCRGEGGKEKRKGGEGIRNGAVAFQNSVRSSN